MDRAHSEPIISQAGHSAIVKIFLHINDQRIRLAQASEKSIKPAERVAVPAGFGNLEVLIDGNSYLRRVNVLSGGVPGGWVQLG